LAERLVRELQLLIRQRETDVERVCVFDRMFSPVQMAPRLIRSWLEEGEDLRLILEISRCLFSFLLLKFQFFLKTAKRRDRSRVSSKNCIIVWMLLTSLVTFISPEVNKCVFLLRCLGYFWLAAF